MAITINLPQNIEADEKSILLLFASLMYEKSKLSLGQAAEVVGISKVAFAELLASQNVSIFNFPASELRKDVENG